MVLLQVCTPFSVLVSAADGYGISVDADSSVRQAIKAGVSGDTLTLETNGNFRTSKPIKVCGHLHVILLIMTARRFLQDQPQGSISCISDPAYADACLWRVHVM